MSFNIHSIRAEAFDHPVSQLRIIETHISWVILTGIYAYKIKKPVNLGFVDFSTLNQRQHYCENEITLNRRLAPDIYLQIVAITETQQNNTQGVSVKINGEGSAIEYAIKMQQFDPEQQLDQLIVSNSLTSEHIEQLASTIARFHQNIDIIDANKQFGQAESIEHAAFTNFSAIRSIEHSPSNTETLDKIEKWTHSQYDQIQNALQQRKQTGHVRNCHGDMHLGNMVLEQNKVIIFDCIEFSDAFRYIDTLNDIAFTIMDLMQYQRYDFATYLLNRYLQITGDYSSIKLLNFYLCYRAMVRAKVNAIFAHQDKNNINKNALKQFRRYIQLAQSFCTQNKPCLIIMHGVSGSGKSTVTKKLLQKFTAIHLRSDIERKRMHGLKELEKSDLLTQQEIYSNSSRDAVYSHLLSLCKLICESGWNVIVDATFLQQQHRQLFDSLAHQLCIPFHIISCQADSQLLIDRVRKRELYEKDASEATSDVLMQQLESVKSLTEQELEHTITVNTNGVIRVDDFAHIFTAGQHTT